MKTLEWQVGLTSTNINTISQPLQCVRDVDLHLLREGRKRKVILGDGNCLFRALAHVAYGSENHHGIMRQILVAFLCKNRPVLLKYITTATFEEHIAAIIRQGAWGTQVELYAAASFYQLPLYLFSPHPKTNNYRWLLFEPEQRSQLLYGENCAPPQTNSTMTHIELCHTTGDHFDCVLTLNNELPNSHPQLDNTSSYINIC